MRYRKTVDLSSNKHQNLVFGKINKLKKSPANLIKRKREKEYIYIHTNEDTVKGGSKH